LFYQNIGIFGPNKGGITSRLSQSNDFGFLDQILAFLLVLSP